MISRRTLLKFLGLSPLIPAAAKALDEPSTLETWTSEENGELYTDWTWSQTDYVLMEAGEDISKFDIVSIKDSKAYRVREGYEEVIGASIETVEKGDMFEIAKKGTAKVVNTSSMDELKKLNIPW